jgi:electron transfer flavoprotein alpha subunit
MTEQRPAEVWVVVDHRAGEVEEASLELLAEGRALADRLGSALGAIALGEDLGGLAEALGRAGVDRAYLADYPLLREGHPDVCTPVLAALIRREEPAMVLFPAERRTREVAPRVAARLGTGLASECTRLDLDAQGLLAVSRPVYGGRASGTVFCPEARPQMATFQPGFGAKRSVPSAREAQVVPVQLSAEGASARTKVERVFRDPPATMDLADAEVVVAGGRGMGGPEGFHLLEELAELLGGALAASRAPVDAGWVPAHRQVGLSGRTVAPRVYMACAISGTVHHLVGMKESKAVIAINTDRHAPIFKLADLGIVGDVLQVVPAVVERLRRTVGTRPSAPDLLRALGGS